MATPCDTCKSKDKCSKYLCTPEKPWTPAIDGGACHSGAVEIKQIDSYPGGDVVLMKCNDCNHEWQQELAQ